MNMEFARSWWWHFESVRNGLVLRQVVFHVEKEEEKKKKKIPTSHQSVKSIPGC